MLPFRVLANQMAKGREKKVAASSQEDKYDYATSSDTAVAR